MRISERIPRSFLLAATLLCAAQGLARADKELDALQHLDAGIKLFERDELERARTEFFAARDLFPQKPNPHRWLGLLEARLGRCAEAVSELDRFLALVPPSDLRVSEAREARDRCRDKL
jgi:Flp pilus assembly protein TadD